MLTCDSQSYRKLSSVTRQALQNVAVVLNTLQTGELYEIGQPLRQEATRKETDVLAQLPNAILKETVHKLNDYDPVTAPLSTDVQKYYVPGKPSDCPCGAGPEDISYRHDACSNNLHCQAKQAKREKRLSSIISVEHAAKIGAGPKLPTWQSHLPANSRLHLNMLRSGLSRTLEDWNIEVYAGKLENADDVVRLLMLIVESHFFLDAVFYDVFRQASAECHERGQLLNLIRQEYATLFRALPEPLRKFSSDLSTQRSVDENLARQLQVFQAWWRGQRKILRTMRVDHENCSGTLLQDTNVLTSQLPAHKEAKQQMRDIIELYTVYHDHAIKELEDLSSTRQKWQDLVYMICGKVIKDHSLVKLTEFHSTHQTWYNSARLQYKNLRTTGKTDALSLRRLQKEMVEVLEEFESQLINQDLVILKLLHKLRESIDSVLVLDIFYEANPAPGKKDIFEEIRRWDKLLEEILCRVQGEYENVNQNLLSKFEMLFEELLFTATQLYTSRQNTGKNVTNSTSSYVGTPVRQPEDRIGEQVLLPREPGYGKSDDDVEGTHYSPLLTLNKEAADQSQINSNLTRKELPEFAEMLLRLSAKLRVPLPDNEKDPSVRFCNNAVSSDEYSKALQKKVLCSETYGLWKTFEATKNYCHSRPYGNITILMKKMKDDIESCLLNLSELTKCSETKCRDRFTEAACSFLDRTTNMINYYRDSTSSKRSDGENTIRQFLRGTAAWLVLWENNLEIANGEIRDAISALHARLVHAGTNLTRYLFTAALHRVSDDAGKSVENAATTKADKLTETRKEIGELVADLYEMSRFLDTVPRDVHLQDVEEETFPQWPDLTSAQGSLTSLVKEWQIYSNGCINTVVDTTAEPENSFMQNSSQSDAGESGMKNTEASKHLDFDKTFENIVDIPNCLYKTTRHAWIREDAVIIRSLGDDENVYAKQFPLLSASNAQREQASTNVVQLDQLRMELAAETVTGLKNLLRLTELEAELAAVYAQNQTQEMDHEHHRLLLNDQELPKVTLPSQPLADLESGLHDQGILPPSLCAGEDHDLLTVTGKWDLSSRESEHTSFISNTFTLIT